MRLWPESSWNPITDSEMSEPRVFDFARLSVNGSSTSKGKKLWTDQSSRNNFTWESCREDLAAEKLPCFSWSIQSWSEVSGTWPLAQFACLAEVCLVPICRKEIETPLSLSESLTKLKHHTQSWQFLFERDRTWKTSFPAYTASSAPLVYS